MGYTWGWNCDYPLLLRHPDDARSALCHQRRLLRSRPSRSLGPRDLALSLAWPLAEVALHGHLTSMAYQETPLRVCVEFQRASQPSVGRIIRLNHNPASVPPQLLSRLHPVSSERLPSSLGSGARS